MDFGSLEALRIAGFHGFSTIRDLQTTRCRDVLEAPGVYLIVRPPCHQCSFSLRSCGGRFKGKDPTVPISRLERLWVDSATVIYIGKAGGGESTATLRERLWAYMRFGAGEPVGHWGGRLIWQIQNSGDLIVCCKPSNEDDAAKTESELICDFAARYGRRPFANLRN